MSFEGILGCCDCGDGPDPGPCETCATCRDDWPATLTLSTPWGDVTLTKGAGGSGASSNDYYGTQAIPGSDYIASDCLSAWNNASTDCSATHNGDVTVTWMFGCAGVDSVRLGWGYQKCVSCAQFGGTGFTDVPVVCSDQSFAACNDFITRRAATYTSIVFGATTVKTDTVRIDGDGSNTCMYCEELQGASVGFAADLAGMGHGSVAVDVSGF